MIFRTPIKTPRLILRHESLQDFDRFYSMSKDPEVMKYIGDGSIFHWEKETALEKFSERLARQGDAEYSNLAVYRVDRKLYIGWCGVVYSRFLDHIELGYRYCSDSWNNGYATEAASALLVEIYQTTDLDGILACVHPENSASIRVLEKIGFEYGYSKLSKPINREIPVYKIERQTFLHK